MGPGQGEQCQRQREQSGEEWAVRELGPRQQALGRQRERGTGRTGQKTGYSDQPWRHGWEQETSADPKVLETTPPPFLRLRVLGATGISRALTETHNWCLPSFRATVCSHTG